MSWITEKPEGVVITIFVQPRASKNKIGGLHGDALKIHLTAPPVDNAANKMCVQFLAKCLNIPRSSLEIIAGQTSRTKLVRVRDAGDGTHLKRKIESLLV
jgi:uncharacterized protein